jgi:hypothetical protein
MIKSFVQENTEQVPGLPERIQATIPWIVQELGDSADRVSIVFDLTERGDPNDRLIEVELIDDIAGSGVEYLGVSAFDRDSKWLRGQIRNLHLEILSRFMKKQVEKMKSNLANPVEA